MKRIRQLARYLYPYKLTLIILFAGMLLQQLGSLFLPTLMSDIIDVGIRQSGIESAVPEAMPIRAYELYTSFMTKDEIEIINKSYRLVGKQTTEKPENKEKEWLKRYPVINNENIFILDKSPNVSEDLLEKYFLDSSIGLVNYMKKNNFVSGSSSDKYQNYDVNLNSAYLKLPKIKDIDKEEINQLRDNSVWNLDPIQTSSAINKQIYSELKMDITKNQNTYILKTGAVMLLVTIGIMLITILESYLSSKMSSGISLKLREDVFKKVESFSNEDFDHFSSASLITRTTNDVSSVKEAILMLTQFIVPPIMLVGGIVMALSKSVSMSWIIVLGALVSAGIIVTSFLIMLPKNELMQKLLDKFNLIIAERLKGTMTIRSFGTQKFEEERFENANKELTDISLFVNRIITFMTPILTISMNIINVLIIWLGANQIEQAHLQVGDMMAFMQYSMIVIGAFLMLVMMFASVPRALISINRIFEILDKTPSISDSQSPVVLNDDIFGLVEFEDVSFKYSNAEEDVLKNISFTASPGQITSIIGSTGSGKSTIVNLIPRFYDVTKGKIMIDGINIKNISQHDLRSKISYVPQNGILFSGSIEYNLKYGNRNADKEMIEKCAEISRIKDFIESKDEKLESKISQGGGNISGGQRQRLAICRALIKNSKIVIFDDSFSSLDFKTESEIKKSLLSYIKDCTVIIVSQRIGTVMNADKIIVMDNGEISGQGTHRELMKSCNVYREIAESQLSEEELA